MIRCWRALVRFWSEPIRAEPAALFRIALGLTGLAYILLNIAPYVNLFWGPDGLFPAAAVDHWLSVNERSSVLRGPTAWLLPYLPDGWSTAWAAFGDSWLGLRVWFSLWLLSLVLVTIGWHTRLATLAAWLLTASFLYRAPWSNNGGDDVFLEGLFYLLLLPAGAAWSVDARFRPTTGWIPPWSVRLLQIQLAIGYLATGLAKLGDDYFYGEAIYWVLQDVSLTRWPYAQFPVPLVLCRLLSWATVAFELSFPFLVYTRFRPYLLLVGVAFHLGIWISMDVGWFSPFTLCWYAVFVRWEGEAPAKP